MSGFLTHILIVSGILFTGILQYCYARNPNPMQFNQNEAAFVFTENKGQLSTENDDLGVLFYAKQGEMICLFKNDAIEFVSVSPDTSKLVTGKMLTNSEIFNIKRFAVRFRNKSLDSRYSAADELPDYSNYYFTHCPEGIHNVKSYKKLIIRNIYDKTDLSISKAETHNGIKLDFILHPGSDRSKIQLETSHFDSLAGNQSNLAASAFSGSREILKITFSDIPLILQNDIISFINNTSSKNKTETSVQNSGKDEEPEILSANLYWATFFGGSSGDHSSYVAVDNTDNVIITGNTLSLDLPVTKGSFQEQKSGFYDVFVTKYSRGGVKQWSTYYGGTEADYASALCTDTQTKIYITGWTWSSDFPISSGCYQSIYGGGNNDGFILKFDNTGRREWATFCGGYNYDHIYGIALDILGNIALTGWTASPNFPVSQTAYQPEKGGSEDAFLISFSNDCLFRWGTFFGGDSTDAGQGIGYDQENNIVIAGYTKSFNFPVTFSAIQKNNSGLFDAFILKFDNSGGLLYSTYYGGWLNDYATSLSIDINSNVIIAGFTSSDDFKTTNGVLQRTIKGKEDCFILKFDGNGSRQWATLLGGYQEDYANSVFTDSDGNILLAGQTYSSDFPVLSPIFGNGLTGISDAFATKITPDGQSLFWSTYYGGPKNDWGYGISADSYKNVLVTGDTEGDQSIITPNADQPLFGGAIDAFLFKRCPTVPKPYIRVSGDTVLCKGESIVLDAGVGFKKYLWSTGETTHKITVKESGTYTVTVEDNSSCAGTSDPVTIVFNPLPVVSISGLREFCENDSTILDAGSGFISYLWSTGETTRSIIIKKTGVYKITVTDNYGCVNSDSAEVIVHESPKPLIRGPRQVCAHSINVLYSVYGVPGYLYKWKVNGGNYQIGTEEANILAEWGNAGTGSVVLEEIDQSTGCVGKDSISILITDKLKPKITSASPDFTFCEGDSLILDGGDGYYKYLWSTGDTKNTITIRKSGVYHITVKDQSGCTGWDTIMAVVFPKPTPVIQGDSVVCLAAREADFQTVFNQGNKYIWKTKGCKVVSGDSTNKIKVSFSDTGTAEIELTETVITTGCSSQAKLLLKIRESLEPRITYTGKTEFCDGDSVILDAGSGYSVYRWSDGSNSRIIIVKKSGKYLVEVANNFGCKGSDSLSVTVRPNPAKPVITYIRDTLFSPPEFEYQWFKDDIEIPDADKQQYFPAESGIYTVKVTNQFGCQAMSDGYKVDIWSGEAFAVFSLPDTIFAGTGEIILVPIYLFDSKNLDEVKADSFSIFLRFNRSLMLPQGNYQTTNLTPAEKSIVLDGIRNVQKGEVARVSFNIALGDVPCAGIYIDSVVWRGNISPVQTDNIDGVLCISNLCLAGGTRLYRTGNKFFINQNSPNPFSGNTIFEFGLAEEGSTRLFITDILGRKVWTIFEKYAKPGNYTVTFSGTDLPSGIYFYILLTPTQIRTGRMEIIK